MIRYAGARLAWLFAVLLGVSVLTFVLGAVAPGDPAELALERILGEPPTGEQLLEKRKELGLDLPIPAQYARWLRQAVEGDLGESWVSGQDVAEALWQRLPPTALLAGTPLAVSVAIALPLGVVAAYNHNTVVDRVCRLGALLGASLPGYLTAYLLILFLAVRLHLLPAFGFTSPVHLVLPALTLAIGSTATLTGFTRAAVLEVLGEGFVQTARAKGVRTSTLLFHHALRNAAIPIVTMLGLSLGGLLTGAFIIEWIFSWPGMGTLAVEAINDKDYPIIQGFVLLTATAYVLVNFLTDILYVSLDPRTRLSGERN